MELFKLLGTIAVKNDEANKAINDTSSKASKMATVVGEKLQSAGKKMSDIGTKLMPVSTAIGGVGIAAAKSSIDFEDAMAKVSTIADLTEVPIEDLQTAIMDLSNQTGISSSEIADNVYNAISAGQETGDAVNFVSNATKLAKAGFAESGDALDILTTIMNSYGLEAKEVTKVSDVLIQTQNLGKTTVAELSSSMGKVIPTANAYGVGLENVATGYATMTAKGIATAESTTYMNSMLNELGKSGTGVSNILQDKTGQSFKDLMEGGASLADVLEIVNEGAEEQGKAFSDVWSSAEAGKAALVMLGDGADEFNSTLEKMNDSTGSTDEAFGKLDTNSTKIKKTLNQLKNTGIELGKTIIETIAPSIEKASVKVKKLNEWFSNLDEGQKETIVKIGMVVASLGPLLIILGKVTTGVGSIVSVVGKLIPMLTGAEGGATGLAAALGGISAPVMAVIGLLVAAFKHLWDTNEEFKNNIIGTWNEIKQTFNEFTQGIVDELNELGFDFENVTDIIKTVWNGLCKFLKPIFEGTFKNISIVFKAITKTILGVLKIFVGIFKGDFSKVISGVKQIVTAGLNLIKGFFKTNFDAINQLTGGKLGDIVEKFKEKIGNIKQTVKDGIDKVKDFFDKLKLKLPDIKLPHFKLSGKFDISEGKVPSIGIDWYAKGGIMTKPAAFGINGNNLMVGGEAGPEAIAPIDLLRDYVKEAVQDANANNNTEKIEDLLTQTVKWLVAIYEKDTSIKIGGREFGRAVRTYA